MKLAGIDYAIQILQHLHRHRGALHSEKHIIEAIGGSYLYFLKIMTRLKKKGLVRAVLGKSSGYQLAQPVHEISVYDVFLAVEGALQIESSPQEDPPYGANTHSNHMRKLVRDTEANMIANMANMSIVEWTSDHPAAQRKQGPADMIAVHKERHYQAFTADKNLHLIPFDEILLFQSGSKSNTIEVHTKEDIFQARGQITRIAKIGLEFFSIHQSYTVNINHVMRIDRSAKKAELSNGKLVSIAHSKLGALISLFGGT